MSEEWLIDGYNLLHDWRSRPQTRRMGRERLFGLLAGFAAAGDRRVTVVLDGAGNPDEFDAYRTPVFQVIYSQDVSADACIERHLCRKRGRASFVVVTRDHAIVQMARGAGARVRDGAELWELLASGDKDRNEILFKNEMKAHGFHRPFQDKL